MLAGPAARSADFLSRARSRTSPTCAASAVPRPGSFVTAPAAAAERDVTIAWSADTVGQGWGINPEWGGLRLYETMRQAEPDLFINSGDTIYADQPVVAEVKLDDGTIWKNLVTEAKSKAAQSVDDFRGAYQYNLLDEHMRRFNVDVAQIVQWDDHEVRDNWYPTRDLSKDHEVHTIKSMALIAEHARQAFLEYNPVPVERRRRRAGSIATVGLRPAGRGLRARPAQLPRPEQREPPSHAGTETRPSAGRRQLAWLKAQPGRIARDLEGHRQRSADRRGRSRRGSTSRHSPTATTARRADASSRSRPAASSSRTAASRNVVWVTADIHYCAAHYYHPTRAKFTDFDPFWEFVAGPLNAGTFGPNKMDATFGPEVKFTGIPPGMKPNRPPSDGFQFFGQMRIDRRTKAMTVSLHDLSGRKIYSQELEARS